MSDYDSIRLPMTGGPQIVRVESAVLQEREWTNPPRKPILDVFTPERVETRERPQKLHSEVPRGQETYVLKSGPRSYETREFWKGFQGRKILEWEQA